MHLLAAAASNGSLLLLRLIIFGRMDPNNNTLSFPENRQQWKEAKCIHSIHTTYVTGSTHENETVI